MSYKISVVFYALCITFTSSTTEEINLHKSELNSNDILRKYIVKRSTEEISPSVGKRAYKYNHPPIEEVYAEIPVAVIYDDDEVLDKRRAKSLITDMSTTSSSENIKYLDKMNENPSTVSSADFSDNDYKNIRNNQNEHTTTNQPNGKDKEVYKSEIKKSIELKNLNKIKLIIEPKFETRDSQIPVIIIYDPKTGDDIGAKTTPEPKMQTSEISNKRDYNQKEQSNNTLINEQSKSTENTLLTNIEQNVDMVLLKDMTLENKTLLTELSQALHHDEKEIVTEKNVEKQKNIPNSSQIAEKNTSVKETTASAPISETSPIYTESSTRKSKYIRQRDPIVPIIESMNNIYSHTGGFEYSYEGGDGTKAFEKGELRKFDDNRTGEAVVGGFSYKDENGNDFKISYTADENGYRPVGAHLPTPPPVPPAIARALLYLATKTTPEPITERIQEK